MLFPQTPKLFLYQIAHVTLCVNFILPGVEQDAVRIFTKYLAREATHPISISDTLRNDTIRKSTLRQ